MPPAAEVSEQYDEEWMAELAGYGDPIGRAMLTLLKHLEVLSPPVAVALSEEVMRGVEAARVANVSSVDSLPTGRASHVFAASASRHLTLPHAMFHPFRVDSLPVVPSAVINTFVDGKRHDAVAKRDSHRLLRRLNADHGSPESASDAEATRYGGGTKVFIDGYGLPTVDTPSWAVGYVGATCGCLSIFTSRSSTTG